MFDRITGRKTRGLRQPCLLSRLTLGAAFLAYFAGTAFLYFLGPWTYPMPQGTGRLVAFLVAVHVAFAVGYFVGATGRPCAARLPVAIDVLVLTAVVIEIALLFPTSALNTGRWIPNPFAAARALGAVYSHSVAIREQSTPYVNYVRILAAPLLAAALPLALFYWHELRLLTRVLFAVSILGTLALFTAMGANAGAGHWMALFPWFVVAAHLSGVRLITRRGWIAAGIILGVSVVLLAVLFSATMVQRPGSFAQRGYFPLIGAYLGDRPPTPEEIAALQPERMQGRSAARIGADGFAGYLTHGYFAVYLSLQQPFVSCHGVGNSVFLQRQVARVTGHRQILDCPYPVRIQEGGWHATRYWATIYPWIASDVTFPGTVVVVGLIGWLAGRVWLDVLGGGNAWAVVLLGQLLLMLYYFPAHNKIMHSGEGILAFAVLLGAWLFTRQRVGYG